MAFSMHSHSGQFCPGHAKDQLEEVIQRAVALKMRLIACTEHMPRTHDQDLYPEEIKAGSTIAELWPRHDAYIKEALRLREKYKNQIKVLIGFEGEWIRPSYGSTIRELAAHPDIDYFIGSVHHVHEIPIDFDRPKYEEARDAAGGTDERLFEDYFDSQFEMLQTLEPRVVGHFDLIRLLSDVPDLDLKTLDGVWKKVLRNLALIKEQGGLVEINSSGLRKGLKDPYPARSVCEAFLEIGGKLTLSDDSHGVDQVGTNFHRAIPYLESLGVQSVYLLERSPSVSELSTGSTLLVTSIDVAELNKK